LFIGYILIAAAPPGLAIIPFTSIVRGNINLSFTGLLILYLSAVFVTPFVLFLFSSNVSIPPLKIFMIMLQLIVLPLILSQVIKKSKLAIRIERFKSAIINWGFFLVTLAVVGSNKDILVSQPVIIARVFLIILLSTLVMILLVNASSRIFHIPLAEQRSYLLFGTIKNAGFSAGIALVFYNNMASLPSVVVSVFNVIYFIYIGFIDRQPRKNLKTKLKID
jgi:BASS family bile acid:Na+ symporter